jgi:phospholipid/cholesterol/gamma-HCH transport system substrate-binding protein
MDRKVLVGVLLLGALLVFALGTFYVKNWQFFLSRGYTLEARFSRVQTLEEGDPVRLAGVVIGTVQSLSVNTDVAGPTPVLAKFYIRKGVKIHSQDKAMIRVGSLFGGNYVDVVRGDATARNLQDGEVIENTGVAPSITEVVETSSDTLTNANQAFADLRKMTTDISEGKGPLGRLINDKEMADKLTKMVDDASSTMNTFKDSADRIQKGEGLLGKFIMDDKLSGDFQTIADNAKGLTDNINAITADLKAGKGTVGKLLASDELYKQFEDTLTSFREGKGLFSKLLNDTELADNVKQAVADLRDVTGKMSKGDSTFGKLLTSSDMYDKLNSSLDDFKTFSSNLANGEGTLPKLVKDDKLYNQIGQILNDVQGILETYREQSPVISLAGAIFGAF